MDGYELFRVLYYSERIPKYKFKHPFPLICFKVLFSALCILFAQVVFTKNSRSGLRFEVLFVFPALWFLSLCSRLVVYP